MLTGCQSLAGGSSTLPIDETSDPLSSNVPQARTPSSFPEIQAGESNGTDSIQLLPFEAVDRFGEDEIEKLSGIVFYPEGKTLFAVNDNGELFEIKTDGTIIQKKEIREEADFEGITYNPTTEMFYIAVEGEEIILEVNPLSLEAEQDIPIDRAFEGNNLISPEGNGIEGITYVPAHDGATNGSYFLVNQSSELEGSDPSIVFEVEIQPASNRLKATIIRYFSVGVTDLSGIHYQPSNHRLLIISDANNSLLEVGLTGEVFGTYELPGKKQEGITLDGDGFLYIAQDKKNGLLKFKSMDGLE